MHNLKTGPEILSSETFDKTTCITTTEGKSLIGNYVARHVGEFQINQNLTVQVDSELEVRGCSCSSSTKNVICKCTKYTVPCYATYDNRGRKSMGLMDDVKQRKGEGEMAAADWLIYHRKNLKPGDAVLNLVTSGDIDAVVIFLFIVAL